MLLFYWFYGEHKLLLQWLFYQQYYDATFSITIKQKQITNVSISTNIQSTTDQRHTRVCWMSKYTNIAAQRNKLRQREIICNSTTVVRVLSNIELFAHSMRTCTCVCVILFAHYINDKLHIQSISQWNWNSAKINKENKKKTNRRTKH